MNPTPRFTGLFIPVEVLNHPDLTLLEQMLLSWVDALYCENHKGCFASNEYFAKKLKVKENTIAKTLTSLRQKNLIQDISFDGRQRVIRAKIGSYVENCQSNSALDLNPIGVGFKSNPALDENPNPTLYIEQSIDQSIDTPPIPPHSDPQNQNVAAALAAVEIFQDPIKKVDKPKPKASDFSPKVKEMSEKMFSALEKANPDWKRPKNEHALLVQLDLMINHDKRDPKRILAVFMWAISDSFWLKNISKPNPIKYLREKFSQLGPAMDAKPSSQIDRRLRDKDGEVVDEYKDHLF